jgi:hypothetical protein
MNKYHEENRLSWNEATIAHNSHKGNQAKFFRDGGNKLYREEKEYPYSNGFKPFNEMHESERRWYLPEGTPNLLLMYAISACKPEQG